MPGRKTPLVNDQVYHLLNRGSASQPIFLNTRDYRRLIKIIGFYRFSHHPVRLSAFLKLSQTRREEYLKEIVEKGQELVEIFCFCLMPNHFHFLVRQKEDEGVSKFMSQIQNSYTRYFNIKNKRVGSLFQGSFKAVMVETDEQLIHVSRYIHLNPYSSYVVKSMKDLNVYPWSSLPDYLGEEHYSFLKKELILGLFKDTKDYRDFVFNQAEYQRELKTIKHLKLEI
jgi:putative transposase